MKTKKKALYRIFFLLAMTLAFTSCEYVGLGVEFGNGTNNGQYGRGLPLQARPVRESGRVEPKVRLGLVERILYKPPSYLPGRILVHG